MSSRSQQSLLARAMRRGWLVRGGLLFQLVGCGDAFATGAVLEGEIRAQGPAVRAPDGGLLTVGDDSSLDEVPTGETQQPAQNSNADGGSSSRLDGSAGQPDGSGSQADGSVQAGARDAGVRDAAMSTPNDASVAQRPDASVTAPDASVSGEQRCIVFLHGKGSLGSGTTNGNGYKYISPNGNSSAWNGQQWLYFPDSGYNQVASIVQSAITSNGCTRVIIHGFSNGAAAAAKLYCRGNTFGGVVAGYIVDDPVPDHGTDGCNRPAGVKVRMYWTGGLNNSTPGWSCAQADWTCEGGETIGWNTTASNLGTTLTQSKYTGHQQYDNPPEYQTFW